MGNAKIESKFLWLPTVFFLFKYGFINLIKDRKNEYLLGKMLNFFYLIKAN